MESVHNMKMEVPNRSNRVQQVKSPTAKNVTAMSDVGANVVTLSSDVELVATYPHSTEGTFIGIMEIKNEFAGNVQ